MLFIDALLGIIGDRGSLTPFSYYFWKKKTSVNTCWRLDLLFSFVVPCGPGGVLPYSLGGGVLLVRESPTLY